MHQKEPYEEIITGKLNALPLPDLSDAIWARIERQLDIDMPEDGGGSGPTPPAGGGVFIGAGFLVFLAALLALLNNPKQNSKEFIATPRNNTQTNTTTNPRTSNKPVGTKPFRQNPEAPAGKLLPPGTEPADKSAPYLETPVAVTTLPEADSTTSASPDIAAGNAMLPVTPPQEKSLDSVKRKRRGVQGIGEQDYRIVPAKNNTP